MSALSPGDLSGGVAARFRRYFWRPPRAHGEVIAERTVGFLELFYDLVFVVLIAQVAHGLADHVSWRGTGDLALVFGLIWVAWVNGAMYHEIHGHEDGRSRAFTFLQMLILVVVAMYAADATGQGGKGFALAFAALLAVLTWLWLTVRWRDTDERYSRFTRNFATMMALSTLVMVVSAFLPDTARLITWTMVVVLWIVGALVLNLTAQSDAAIGVTVTESLVERFGLFTIIVLGEVVVGVVDGCSATSPSPCPSRRPGQPWPVWSNTPA